MTDKVITEKRPNAWIAHLKSYSLEHGIPYASAISDPRCKEAYNKSKGTPTEPKVNKPKVNKPKVKKPKHVEPEPEPEVVVEKKENKKKKKKKNKEVPEVPEVAVEEE